MLLFILPELIKEENSFVFHLRLGNPYKWAGIMGKALGAESESHKGKENGHQ